MADKFLNTGGTGGGSITNGSVNIYGATIGADNLDPSAPIKTNSTKQLISSSLDIADTINLQSELDNKNKLDFSEVVSPVAPATDTLRLFAKDNKFYYKNDLGVESLLATSSGGVAGNTWQFSTALSGVPASGVFRFNNSTITEIAVSVINKNGSDQRPILLTLGLGDQILTSNANASNDKLFNITGLPVDNTTWFSIPVVVENQNNSLTYLNTELISFTFYPQANTLQSSFNISSKPQITTLTSNPLQLRYQGEADSDDVLEILNDSGVSKFTVNGNGHVNTSQINLGTTILNEGLIANSSGNLTLNAQRVLYNQPTIDGTVPSQGADVAYVDSKFTGGLLVKNKIVDNYIISNETTAGQSLNASSKNNYLWGGLTGSLLTDQDNNIYIGKASGEKHSGSTSGSVGIGHNALKNNSGLGMNTAIGNASQLGSPSVASTGSGNSSLGRRSLNANITGNNNVAVGEDSMRLATAGFNNSALGFQSLISCTDGSNNIGIGAGAGGGITSGGQNIGVGSFCGTSLTTGSGNTMLGNTSNVSNSNSSFRIALGFDAVGDIDKHCVIGSNIEVESIISIKPGFDSNCDLGTANKNFKDIYLAGEIDINASKLKISSDSTNGIIQTPAGVDIKLIAGGGDINLTGTVNVGDNLSMFPVDAANDKILSSKDLKLVGGSVGAELQFIGEQIRYLGGAISNDNQLATKLYVDRVKPTSLTTNAPASSSYTPEPNIYRQESITSLGIALLINTPGNSGLGGFVDGQKFTLRIKDDGTARALTYSSNYDPIGVIRPATTVANKFVYIGCIYNASSVAWDVVSVAQEV